MHSSEHCMLYWHALNLRYKHVKAYLGTTPGAKPKFCLGFPVSIPPLGFNTYFVSNSKKSAHMSSKSSQYSPQGSESSNLQVGQGNLKLQYNAAGALSLYSDSKTQVQANFEQKYMYYIGQDGNASDPQASGAYIFRPNGTVPIKTDDQVLLTFLHGPIVDEVHQQINSWIYQITRVYKGKDYVETEFIDTRDAILELLHILVVVHAEFAALRKKYCPSDIDYIRLISRCKQWSAQGGKSNVYFTKTMDERFIIKQVTKTELASFVEFARHYFRHMTESLTSRSPTCLAKIVGLYQVSIQNSKGGRQVKMDLMVMENLFFQRSISRVYDLKGSVCSRYNFDASGHNKVLLDSNLIEALHTEPMFLGSKAKQRLERALWNDASFLASLDVMVYSLSVGVDEEKKELVVRIIDFLRQYTWDKQLETCVKASAILGGPKNEAPTVISPIQYKRRFRKAISRYFLTVPDQWTS